MTTRYNPEKVKKANIKFHDLYEHKIYAKRWHSKFDNETMKKIIKKYEKIKKAKLNKVDKILDLGCGIGFIIVNFSLSNLANQLHGVDISRGMLNKCEENARKLREQIFLICADTENLPYKNSSFDLITGHAFLHHVPNTREVFIEIYRLLKPSGYCIISGEATIKGNKITNIFFTIIWGLPYNLLKMFKRITNKAWVSDDKEVLSQLEAPVDLFCFSPRELEDIVRDVGFSEIRIKTIRFVNDIFLTSSLPLTKRTSNRIILKSTEKISNFLNILDENFFAYFIPEDWFTEITIYLKK